MEQARITEVGGGGVISDLGQSNGSSKSQGDLFLYTGRETKSAPSGPLYRSNSSSTISLSARETTANKAKGRTRNKYCHRSAVFYIFAHAPEFTNWTTSFSGSSRVSYLSLFFVETVLRSIGDITFANNPWSGLLIFLAMLVDCPQTAFIAFITLVLGLLTAVCFLKVPLDQIRQGAVLFNNYLAGTVIVTLAHSDVLLTAPEIIPVSMLVGILTVVIWSGLNGILATRVEYPLINCPFHVMLLLYMYCGIASHFKWIEPPQHQLETSGLGREGGDNYSSGHLPSFGLRDEALHNSTNITGQIMQVDWGGVLRGIVLAPSHVFATTSPLACVTIYVAKLVCSPILAVQSLSGAAIGTLTGLLLSTPAEYRQVYDGSWAYNSLFTSAALGGYFLVFSFHSWLLASFGALISTLLYSAMKKLNVPALGIPFMLTTWLLLPSIPIPSQESSTSSVDDIAHTNMEMERSFPQTLIRTGPFIRLRLVDITTPELHLKLLLMSDKDDNPQTGKYGQVQPRPERTPDLPPDTTDSSVLPL